MSVQTRSRSAFCFGLLLALAVAPAAHTAPNPADYPLRIRVLQNHWNGNERHGFTGYGRANLFDGTHVNAMDYTFECSVHFMTSEPGESFPAKWKKQGQEAEMLIGVIGSNSVDKCTLKTALKDFVFVRQNGELMSVSEAEFQAREARRAQRGSSSQPEENGASQNQPPQNQPAQDQPTPNPPSQGAPPQIR